MEISMSHPTLQRIIAEHKVIAAMMDAMDAEITALETQGAFDIDLVRLILRYMAEYPDRFHHPKEEVLFDAAEAKDSSFAAMAATVRDEHNGLPGQTAHLAEMLSTLEIGQSMPLGDVLRALHDYVSKEREHMRRERDEVFPRLEALLTDEQWEDAEACAQQIDDPLFHGGTPGPFRRLQDLILPKAA